MEPKSIGLLQNIDVNVEQILQKFQDIFEVSIVENKSRELLAVEALAMETDALTIIRLCEDLLSVTRGLRESWCLGSLKVAQAQDQHLDQSEIDAVFGKFNELTSKISEIGTS